MATFDDELLQDAEDDRQTIEYIKQHRPQELKDRFSDDDLYYFLDVIVEYYTESGILDAQPDKDGYINIDIEAIAQHMAQQARKDKVGEFSADDLRWIVEAEMDYADSLDE